MRIIILSIALLFCAFSAQSQVLKSAGVWYFLDVDSMTVRPAVLPNGTELAYVIGTRKIYNWNRTTLTWDEYGAGGSYFNRDSIYFDASVIGSGTVSDPWGIDSTLFATIAGVGDSIAAALADYVEIADTAAMLANYPTFGDVNTSLGNYLPILGGTLTGTGGNGFLGLLPQSSTPSTPASGFRLFANGAHNLALRDRNGWITTFDISATANRDFAYPSVGGTFALGTGTANRVPLWTATNTLGNSNIQDNNTVVSLLNSKPFQLGQWTTAGRPAGVNGYKGLNTTTGFEEGYFTSQWENFITSTGALANQVPYYISPGKIGSSPNLTYDPSISSIRILSTSAGSAIRGLLVEQNSTGPQAPLITFRKIDGTGAVNNSYFLGSFAFQGYSGTQYITDNSYFGAVVTGSVTSSSVPTSIFFRGGATTGYNPQFLIHSGGNTGIGALGTIFPLTLVAPPRTLTVYGEQRITDLTTDAPTLAIGADADGDLGALSLGSGVSISGGVLGVNTLYTGNGILPENRMVNLNKKTLQFSNNGFFSIYSDQTSGTWGSSFELDTFSRTYQYRYTNDTGEPRYVLGHARGTRTSPTSLQKLDRTGGYYFQAYYNGAWRKTGVLLGEVDSVSGSALVRGVIRISVADNNFPETTGADQLRITKNQVTTRTNHVVTNRLGVGYSSANSIDPASASANITHQLDVIGNAQVTGKTIIGLDSTFSYDPTTDLLQLSAYGTPATTAAALSKTLSPYGVGFATDGTITSREIKRDTTIYIVDTDYNFSAAITTAQISRRYNRITFFLTTTAAAGSNSDLTLHTPDINLMQVEYLIRSTDETGGFTNTIQFGSNNAVDSINTLVSSYTPSQGQGVGIRAGLRSGVYKYYYY